MASKGNAPRKQLGSPFRVHETLGLPIHERSHHMCAVKLPLVEVQLARNSSAAGSELQERKPAGAGVEEGERGERDGCQGGRGGPAGACRKAARCHFEQLDKTAWETRATDAGAG